MGRPALLAAASRVAMLAPGIVPLGLLYGAVATAAGFHWVEVVLMSGFVFAGVAQFATASLHAADAPVVAVVAAVAVINARYLLLSTATLDLLRQRGATRLVRWLGALLVVDESYALQTAWAREERVGALSLVLVGAILWLMWMVATLVGIFIGEAMPNVEPYGLDYALPGLFVGIFGIFADTTERLWAGLGALALGGLLAWAGLGTAAAVLLPSLGALALGRWKPAPE